MRQNHLFLIWLGVSLQLYGQTDPVSVRVPGIRIQDSVFTVEIPVAGRYRVEICAQGKAVLGLEDYIYNADKRTYDITADMPLNSTGQLTVVSKDGSPLDAKEHPMRLHIKDGEAAVEWIQFTLLKEHELTPYTLKQSLEGKQWVLVWSDEFETAGLPDPKIWNYEVGNWGWGNREPQYYTENRLENARCENGRLIVEARKDGQDGGWTSARLITAGRVSFLYGRIEFSAKVSAGNGSWAAVWLLGDAYRDEISWPYCGEMDLVEAHGNEIHDETGEGLVHFACHTRAYYFKQNNHISAWKKATALSTQFHHYAMEWIPERILMFLDGELVYTYDKNADQTEFPFNSPQNLIVNMAMGGNSGGTIDPALTSAKIELEYIRVYGRK